MAILTVQHPGPSAGLSIRKTGSRFLWIIVFAALMTAACSKRARPIPPPPPPPADSSDQPRISVSDPSMPAPELQLFLEPQVIVPGDSALLSWDTKNADRIVIDQGIGNLGVQGRVRLFPEKTTTYRVAAEGPGGTIEETVTLEIRDRLGTIDQPSLDSLPLEEQFNLAFKPVYFEFGSADLTGEAQLTLDGNLRWLLQKRELLRLEIQGHCDVRGSEEFNLALGDRRAQTVRAYLLEKGVGASRLVAFSLGEESPAVSGDSEEAHALNRRVQFRLLDR